MVCKFLACDIFPPDPNFDYDSFHRELCLSYGTLMDPKGACQSASPERSIDPSPCQDYRLQIRDGEPYSALIGQGPGQATSGVVCEISPPSEKRRLEKYDT